MIHRWLSSPECSLRDVSKPPLLFGIQNFQNILCCPLTGGPISKRDFVLNEFPAFCRVEGGIPEIEVDHLTEFFFIARNSACFGIPEAFMCGPVADLFQG